MVLTLVMAKHQKGLATVVSWEGGSGNSDDCPFRITVSKLATTFESIGLSA
jgi:hypothetical protein